VDVAAELTGRYTVLRDSADLTERASYAWPEATLLLARGRHADALRVASAAWDFRDAAGVSSESLKETFPIAVEAALRLGDHAAAERLLEAVDEMRLGRVPQSMRAQAMRFRALLAAAGGDDERAERSFRGAASLLRELATPFPMAVVTLEQAEWLSARGRGDEAEPGLAEARAVFERLRAMPWLERAAPAEPAAVGTGGGARPGRPTSPLVGASVPGEPLPSLSATARRSLRFRR
jgi:ATP/maltotriose-dependent transcriptional regulator MalT